MSASCFPQEFQAAVLAAITGKSGPINPPLTLKLYSNAKTPARTDTAADYNEVSGGGYADVELSGGVFTINEANPSEALYNSFVEFFFTSAPSPATVYGAYIVDDSGVLVSAERFDTAPVTIATGYLIKYKPRIALASANP